jgi:hypothetical protein
MKKKRWRDMKYNEDLDCWVVFWEENTGYKMRCGDWFELHLGEGRKLTCRIELGREWYVIVGFNETKFYLKPNEVYQVDI